MIINKTLYGIISFLLLLLLSSKVNAQMQPQSEHSYIVLYVETIDTVNVNNCIAEFTSYSNKIISAKFNWTTHEFSFVYTPLMRDDTIIQILLTYFDDLKKVRGTYIPINE